MKARWGSRLHNGSGPGRGAPAEARGRPPRPAGGVWGAAWGDGRPARGGLCVWGGYGGRRADTRAGVEGGWRGNDCRAGGGGGGQWPPGLRGREGGGAKARPLGQAAGERRGRGEGRCEGAGGCAAAGLGPGLSLGARVGLRPEDRRGRASGPVGQRGSPPSASRRVSGPKRVSDFGGRGRAAWGGGGCTCLPWGVVALRGSARAGRGGAEPEGPDRVRLCLGTNSRCHASAVTEQR